MPNSYASDGRLKHEPSPGAESCPTRSILKVYLGFEAGDPRRRSHGFSVYAPPRIDANLCARPGGAGDRLIRIPVWIGSKRNQPAPHDSYWLTDFDLGRVLDHFSIRPVICSVPGSIGTIVKVLVHVALRCTPSYHAYSAHRQSASSFSAGILRPACPTPASEGRKEPAWRIWTE